MKTSTLWCGIGSVAITNSFIHVREEPTSLTFRNNAGSNVGVVLFNGPRVLRALSISKILYRNKEKYTVTNTYILCSYSKLSQRIKDEIECLFIAHNNDDINNHTASN